MSTAIDVAPFHAAEVVADVADLDRDEWLAARRPGLGGSDAAAIVGLSPYRSRLDVWLDKTGALVDDTAGEAADWGTLLEPVVRDETARRLGTPIEPVPWLLRSTSTPFALANLDGHLPDEHAGYEGKAVSQWAANEWGDDQVPDQYMVQVQHYLHVTGLDRWVIAALLGGQRLVVREVRRDQQLIDDLLEVEAEFWELVESGTPPAADGSKACTELLAGLWDVNPGSVLTVTGDDLAEVRELLAARAQAAATEKAGKAAKAEAENQLKQLCADHEVVVDPDGRELYTWKEQTRRGLDEKLLAQVHTDLVVPFRTTTRFRKLHCKAVA